MRSKRPFLIQFIKHVYETLEFHLLCFIFLVCTLLVPAFNIYEFGPNQTASFPFRIPISLKLFKIYAGIFHKTIEEILFTTCFMIINSKFIFTQFSGAKRIWLLSERVLYDGDRH